jgi:hypothetical protein
MENPPFSGMIDGYSVNLFLQFTQHYTPTTYPHKPELPMSRKQGLNPTYGLD